MEQNQESTPVRLLIAPAGAGKTAYAVSEARRQAEGLRTASHVLVASALQAQAFRRRLARAGGAIGVRVLTFEELYRLCLSTADAVYSEISAPVQHRVIRSVVRQLPLVHYAPLTERPGFVQVLTSIIGELKAARVQPQSFTQTVAAHGNPARLRELARIYAAYQALLRDEKWADPAGMGWLTVKALEGGASQLGTDCSFLLVDGFDDFTPVQLTVLGLLAERVERMVITLTGRIGEPKRPLVHRRFDHTRRELVETLSIEPEPLPDTGTGRAPTLIHLGAGLFQSEVSRTAVRQTQLDDTAIHLIEASNPAQEVRAALRWLKREILERNVSLGQLALLARDVTPYRPFINQVADEFGLPVHFYAGRPLARNPVVAALLDLLRLTLPADGAVTAGVGANGSTQGLQDGEPSLPPRLVIDAWRSPYFDWSADSASDASSTEKTVAPIGIEPGDADALDVVARRGRVIVGLAQWQAAFEALQGTEQPEAMQSPRETAEDREIREDEISPRMLTGRRVSELRGRFRRFVQRLSPPAGSHAARDFVRWLETLIGPDPETWSRRFPQPQTPASLNVIARVRQADGDGKASASVVARDLAALRCLKEILEGLVWAEKVLGDPPITFPRFFEDLSGAVEAAFYRLPRRHDGEEILVTDVVAARGVPFQSVAVLGLAEGFFPAPQDEDPLLWDADRKELNLPLEPSTQSAEAEYFYETIAAPAQRLLLTRPRLADDGAPWEASPFWEEIQRLVGVEPTATSEASGLDPRRAASWPELLQSATAFPKNGNLWAWLRETLPVSVEALETASQVFTWRQNRADTPFEGGLHELRDHFTTRFHPGHTWSASRLEAYRTCPFYFFVSKVLALEPREEPAEGIGWLQRGNLYHEILERVYRAVEDPTDLNQLIAALPRVARSVLDAAPERQGFRRTAWWAHTCQEIVEDVQRSLEALSEEEQLGGFIPLRYEAAFGLEGEPPLVVRDASTGDAFQLRGFIDRVDRSAEGGVRIIDYKTGGPSSYGNSAIRSGQKLQLPLYALAARDALGLGLPLSGFYWHVRHAEASPFKLEEFGPEAAIRTAVDHAWEAVRGAREGRFMPRTPEGGCPAYCPAVGFCWRYERSWFDANA